MLAARRRREPELDAAIHAGQAGCRRFRATPPIEPPADLRRRSRRVSRCCAARAPVPASLGAAEALVALARGGDRRDRNSAALAIGFIAREATRAVPPNESSPSCKRAPIRPAFVASINLARRAVGAPSRPRRRPASPMNRGSSSRSRPAALARRHRRRRGDARCVSPPIIAPSSKTRPTR